MGTEATAHYRAVIDALTAHVALLDQFGGIVVVNEAWRQYADANGSKLPNYGVGCNYLGLLSQSVNSSDDGTSAGWEDRRVAQIVMDGISSVLSGVCPKFQIEYPCHAPHENRWFLLTVTPFAPGSQARVVVSHENITSLKSAENQVRAQGIRLLETFSSMVEAIALAIEMRDPYTAGHQRQVATLAVEIGRIMQLSEDQLFGLRLGATIHDIGKISIPVEILNRPGALSTPQYQIIRRHPDVGHEILRGIEFLWPIADMVWQHHERLDGSGYPLGLKGNEICIEARIIAVADVFDAIISHRPYRPARNMDMALTELHQGRGTAYDPDVVDAGLSFFAEVGSEWHRAHLTHTEELHPLDHCYSPTRSGQKSPDRNRFVGSPPARSIAPAPISL